MLSMLDGFRKFITRGNVIDLAVGVVIGASFGAVVTTLVKGLLTPLIGAIAHVPDFSNLVFYINGSKFAYGEFINAAVSFFLVAAAIYFFVIWPFHIITERVHRHKRVNPTTKKCPECLSEIPVDAKRCAHCTQIVV